MSDARPEGGGVSADGGVGFSALGVGEQQLDGREGRHFPQDEEGAWAGHYPADSGEAIAHLEELRAKGAQFIVFPAAALWWLDHYVDFAQHLDSRHRVVARSEDCAIFALR